MFSGVLGGGDRRSFFEIGEGVTDVLEFIVEVFAVPGEPVLEGFEEVSRETGRVSCGVAVICDFVESL